MLSTDDPVRALGFDAGLQTLYAGLESAEIYVSNNLGLNWTLIDSGLDPNTRYIWDFAFKDNGDVYALTSQGVYFLANGSSSWLNASPALEDPWSFDCILLDLTDPLTFYVAGDYGIQMTEDGGNSFSLVTAGLPSTEARGRTYYHVSDLETGPSGTIYASINGSYLGSDAAGIYQYDPTTRIWSPFDISGSLLSQNHTSHLAFSDTQLYASLEGFGVVSTPINSVSWTERNTGLSEFYLVTYTQTPNTAYAASRHHIYSTPSGLNNWTLLEYRNEAIQSLAVDGDTDIYIGLIKRCSIC